MSTKNWTPATPTLSEADAETESKPETTALGAGDSIETEGAVVSSVDKVIVLETDADGLPEASVAYTSILLVPGERLTAWFQVAAVPVRDILFRCAPFFLIYTSASLELSEAEPDTPMLGFVVWHIYLYSRRQKISHRWLFAW